VYSLQLFITVVELFLKRVVCRQAKMLRKRKRPTNHQVSWTYCWLSRTTNRVEICKELHVNGQGVVLKKVRGLLKLKVNLV